MNTAVPLADTHSPHRQATQSASNSGLRPEQQRDFLRLGTDNPNRRTTANTTSTRSWTESLRRARVPPVNKTTSILRSKAHLSADDRRRDSALTSNTIDSASSIDRNLQTRESSVVSDGAEQDAVTLPAILVTENGSVNTAYDSGPNEKVMAQTQQQRGRGNGSASVEGGSLRTKSFKGITTDIPAGGFDNFFAAGNLSFSKRGSILLGSKPRGEEAAGPQMSLDEPGPTANAGRGASSISPKPLTQSTSVTPITPTQIGPGTAVDAQDTQLLSPYEELSSQKVRSMYEHGNESAADLVSFRSSMLSSRDDHEACNEEELEDVRDTASPLPNIHTLHIQKRDTDPRSRRHSGTSSRRQSFITRESTEAAGGMEDWKDVSGGDVDRYGFIVPKRVTSGTSSIQSASTDPQLHRITTSLQLISDEPRKRRTFRNAPSSIRSFRSAVAEPAPAAGRSPKKSGPQAASLRSGRSAGSSATAARSSLRVVANRLPYNRERRCVDEASDMLTLPPGLADIAEQEDGGRTAQAMKTKEWEREEKWRRMGKIAKSAGKGGGMVFVFDTRDPKLIDRTWKGIPDRWRAAAWWSFLEASAKKKPPGHAGATGADELVDIFFAAQEKSCVDDVQIDVDVPRTISSHIMFRRRYRGGQRSLFRVLHALSLHLPEIGYVQGMAALAATLLCYYDEEKAFVMMFRLWQLRGLDELYRSGFGGLMEALEQFEREWLEGGQVAEKLKEYNISSTAYGTRWYLTLFNYSIPFPAQLRVWDVFMLLGDVSDVRTTATTTTTTTTTAATTTASPVAAGATKAPLADLDVLHATSAALIDAEREILLDSDFENAMKVLTSWIPIRDEDFLMRVARAEYRRVRRREGRPC